MNNDVPADLFTRTRTAHKMWWKAWQATCESLGMKPDELEVANVNQELRQQFGLEDADERLANICREVAETAEATDLDSKPAHALEILMGWAISSPTMLGTESLKEAKTKADDLLSLAKQVSKPTPENERQSKALSHEDELALECLRRANGREVRARDIRRAMEFRHPDSQNNARRQRRSCDTLRSQGLAEKVRNGWWRSLEASP